MVTLLAPTANRTAVNIEHLAPGTTCEWLADGQIIVLTATDSSRTSIDAWMGRCIEIANAWPRGRPMCVIVDSSSPRIDRTPYMRERLKEFRTLRPDLKWYVAMLAPKTYLMQLMSIGLRVVQSNRETRIFFKRADALKWLIPKLAVQPKLHHP